MILSLEVNGKTFRFDTSKPLDISTPLLGNENCVNAFSVDPPRFEPLRAGGFTGSVAEGGPCNCEDLFLNAHGNGTHTECVGHITPERVTINKCLREFLFLGELMTITPEARLGDHVISRDQVEEKLRYTGTAKALIIRTLPNDESKLHRKWSGSNPPYVDPGAMEYLVSMGYEHLLLDLPSVDREEDGGELLAHRAFWSYPEHILSRRGCTITEMIYVKEEIPDGLYLLNIQVASLESDASPSKPVLYQPITS